VFVGGCKMRLLLNRYAHWIPEETLWVCFRQVRKAYSELLPCIYPSVRPQRTQRLQPARFSWSFKDFQQNLLHSSFWLKSGKNIR
jgi:hypothetical protein